MAGMQPIQGPSPTPFVTPAARQAAGATGDARGPAFTETLRGAMEHVDSQQQQSSSAVQELLTGRSQDVLGVVTSVAEADMSFKLLMGVRNKVIEAYKQMMNMQV